MTLKDKIEETITFYLAERDFYGVCWVEDAADAIIAALPIMIAPLVWTHQQVMGCDGLVSGDYSVYLGRWWHKDTPMSQSCGLNEDAISAANNHHRAAIMAAFKGEKT